MSQGLKTGKGRITPPLATCRPRIYIHSVLNTVRRYSIRINMDEVDNDVDRYTIDTILQCEMTVEKRPSRRTCLEGVLWNPGVCGYTTGTKG